MDDGLPKLEVIPDHFLPSTPSQPSLPKQAPSTSDLKPDNTNTVRSYSRSWASKKFRSAASMLNIFNLRGLSWVSDGMEKVVLTAAELGSLRSELADLEESEALRKAQLEHIDEILRSARLSGYLDIRTRWAALPGEPLPIDDTDVDDWLPRFVVLHGTCIFFYLRSTDLSPVDSTLLSDIVEIVPRPSFLREEYEERRHCFHILTRHGLRFECSSESKVQIGSWVTALRDDCKFTSEADASATMDPN